LQPEILPVDPEETLSLQYDPENVEPTFDWVKMGLPPMIILPDSRVQEEIRREEIIRFLPEDLLRLPVWRKRQFSNMVQALFQNIQRQKVVTKTPDDQIKLLLQYYHLGHYLHCEELSLLQETKNTLEQSRQNTETLRRKMKSVIRHRVSDTEFTISRRIYALFTVRGMLHFQCIRRLDPKEVLNATSSELQAALGVAQVLGENSETFDFTWDLL